MFNDQRKSRRVSVDRRVWIDLGDGSPPLECRVVDMSDTGAKLSIGEAKPLPRSFVLRLSEDGRVARKCRVAWSAGGKVGVAFTARLVGTPGNSA